MLSEIIYTHLLLQYDVMYITRPEIFFEESIMMIELYYHFSPSRNYFCIFDGTLFTYMCAYVTHILQIDGFQA